MIDLTKKFEHEIVMSEEGLEKNALPTSIKQKINVFGAQKKKTENKGDAATEKDLLMLDSMSYKICKDILDWLDEEAKELQNKNKPASATANTTESSIIAAEVINAPDTPPTTTNTPDPKKEDHVLFDGLI